MDEAQAVQDKKRRVRLLFPAPLVVGGIATIAVGASYLWRHSPSARYAAAAAQGSLRGAGVVPAADQNVSESDRAAIAALIQRETGAPIQSLTRFSDDSVEAFVGADEYLGRQIFTLRKFDGQWPVEQVTYVY